MTVSGCQIQDLVMRMQEDFLDTPGLALMPDDAERRFGVDARTCDAVLTALVEANVLTRNGEGAYVRFFPRPLRHTRAGSPHRQGMATRRADIRIFPRHAA